MKKKNNTTLLQPLNIFAIKDKLNTSTIGQDIRYFHRIDSTNNYALNAALHGTKEGTVIVSDEQTFGRGRHQRKWKSDAYKGIYLSIILKPKILKGEPTLLSLLAAIVVVEAIKEFYPFETDIKWPNDILIKDKKAAGVLIEINTQGSRIMHVVVGMGINVFQNEEDLSGITSYQATSLLLESDLEIPREALIAHILQNFERWYRIISEEGPQPILSGWKQLSTFWQNKRVKISSIGRNFTGATHDINDDGSLMVKKDNGLMERVLSGNIIAIREEK